MTWGELFVFNKTFQYYLGIINPTYLLLWTPSIIIFLTFSIIVHFSTRDMKKYICQIFFGIFATICVSFILSRGGGLQSSAGIIDHIYYYIDIFIPMIGTILGIVLIKLTGKTEQKHWEWLEKATLVPRYAFPSPSCLALEAIMFEEIIIGNPNPIAWTIFFPISMIILYLGFKFNLQHFYIISKFSIAGKFTRKISFEQFQQISKIEEWRLKRAVRILSSVICALCLWVSLASFYVYINQ